MAITVTKDLKGAERITRNLHILTGSIAFDASYPTGGESASDITKYFKTCHRVILECNSGYVFEWDKTNSKILAYYADYDAVADGALIQVPDTTDLSALTAVSFIATGLN